MELADRLLVDRFVPQNRELQGLIESHQRFESEINDLNARTWLSAYDLHHLRVLKKKKLRGRDRIEEILRGYRTETDQS